MEQKELPFSSGMPQAGPSWLTLLAQKDRTTSSRRHRPLSTVEAQQVLFAFED
jgi:hypothetical protein